MNWKLKAAIQRACAALPVSRESLYYLLQKCFSDVVNFPDPLEMIAAAADLARQLEKAGRPILEARVFEIGTGRRIDIPIGFFLAGAESITTVDLHPYLKPELVLTSLTKLKSNRPKIREFFAPVTDGFELDRRLDILDAVSDFDDLLAKTNIVYRAPFDARDTGLPDGSFDVSFSYTVFEHIPPPVLEAILRESDRLVGENGVALHHIDLSDHFAQDGQIHPINFLQYSEKEWDWYANNQFAYHNRLRACQYRAIYEGAGQDVIIWVPHVDQKSLAALAAGFRVHPMFSSFPAQELCTSVLRVVSRRKQKTAQSFAATSGT